MRKKLIAAPAIALALGGCGLQLFGPEPGLTTVTYSADDGFLYESGKEFAKATGKFEHPSGLKGEFEVLGVEAFPGQAIAAQVQMQQLEMMAGMMKFIEPLLRAGAAAYGVPLPAPAPAVDTPPAP